MANQEFYSRIIHKHDTEANWNKAATNSNFIPKQGEIIIYDKDDNYEYERIKIGDGIAKVDTLPFIDKTLADLIGTKSDANTIDTAFGRIAKAQAAAEAVAGNLTNIDTRVGTLETNAPDASNLTTGTLPAARLPAATSSALGGVKIGSNISISEGKISVPTASGTQAGVTIVYPADSCTSFSSDSGTVTPLAVQKGAKMFAITRPNSSTVNAITRYSNTTGDVKDSKIAIEDVTNTKDTSKKAQVIAIPAEGGKKMVYGYCTDQVDGTSFIGGIFDADATSYPYNAGLAIGGTSGNLLWKGNKVIDASCIGDYANKYTLPAATSSTLGGVKVGSNITNSSGTISLTKANVTSALGYTPPTTDTKYTLSSFGITATAAELNKLDGVTTSTAELNFVKGATSNIQDQLNKRFKKLGDNPLTNLINTEGSEHTDNPASWIYLGTGQCFIGAEDRALITNYPGGYNSHMFNFTTLGDTDSVAHQIIFTTAGKIYHRHGNGEAWTTDWIELFDNNNLDSVEIVDATGSTNDMDVIFQSGRQVKVYRTDGETLNTPYKAGKTGTYTGSYIFTITGSTTYGTQMAFINGGSNQYTRKMSNGTIGEWTKVITEANLGTQVTYTLNGTALTITTK